MADRDDSEAAPDFERLKADPEALKHAHERYGSYLKQTGLPFEDDEFDESADGDSSDDAGNADPNDDAGNADAHDGARNDDAHDGVAGKAAPDHDRRGDIAGGPPGPDA